MMSKKIFGVGFALAPPFFCLSAVIFLKYQARGF